MIYLLHFFPGINIKKYAESFFYKTSYSWNPRFNLLKRSLILALFLISGWAQVHAVELNDITSQLTSKSRSKVKAAVVQLGNSHNTEILPILEAMKEKSLRFDGDDRFIFLEEEEGKGILAFSGEIISTENLDLRKPKINNSVRRALSVAIGKLKLVSKDPKIRLNAAEELLKRPSADMLESIESILEVEKDERIREVLSLVLAKGYLKSDDPGKRLKAVLTIEESGGFQFKSDLEEIIQKDEEGKFIESSKKIREAAQNALASLERQQFFVNISANIFYGLSLGSILLLAALGLAITFGLMGVINMAHGEMIMLGAYSTFLIQNLFQAHFPSLIDWYLLVAAPIAFIISALMGIFLEKTIIRHLYGRPLETLLATWGISLLLIQSVRLIFGAQNVEVANPSWLSGGGQVFEGVVFPYNRICIILFVIFVVAMVWALLQKTSLGLQVRAVTQNRKMASCMGISTSKIDMLTFGLGSGVAGLGGVALSQIGNVGPELGQSYIVDSFMVVVLGGVGKIAGTVIGAVGLGLINKFLEPVAGAVLGKILVLVLIILVIQKKPQGLFALKGRLVD